MKNKLRRSYQRKLNKVVKDMNENIANDDLWKGRFVFHIMATEFEKFSDGSGGLLHAIIRGYDKAEGYYKDYIIAYAPWLHYSDIDVWRIGNGFITEDSGTYKNGNPFKDKENIPDYTKVKVHKNIWNLKETKLNFYISFEIYKNF